MRFWLTGVLALMLTGVAGWANEQDLQFPKPGTPYPDARTLLLRQGAKPAPSIVTSHDHAFPELDCDRRHGCRAVFYIKAANGWQEPVVVYVDQKTRTVIDADYARPVDGVPSISPPFPANVPKVRGSYMRARTTLKAMGYKPSRNGMGPAPHCPDNACKKLEYLPEAQCAADAPLCIAYWTAPNGRVLKIHTEGEIDLHIAYMEWVPKKELSEFEQH